jgi:uncharacterized surface protein with fasciclin (FAS1) repeats
MFKHILLSLTVAATAATAATAQQVPAASPSKAVLAVRAAALAGKQAGGPIRVVPPHVINGTNSSSTRTIVENLEDLGGYLSFVQSAERAGLIQTLQSAGPYTLFVPSDAAFAQLPAGALADLWKPSNRARLYAMLAGHIVTTNLREQDLTDGRVLTTLAGTPLTVRRVGARLALEDAQGKRAYVATADLTASNGTVHVLDRVLARP